MSTTIERATPARARQVRLALGGRPEATDFLGDHWVALADPAGDDEAAAVGVLSLLPGGDEPWTERQVVGPLGQGKAELLWAAWTDTDRPLTKASQPLRPSEPHTYCASSIRVLHGTAAVRMRPGMYFGGTGARGVWHLLAELLANVLDEHLGGHAQRLDVSVGADGRLEVEDDGRGAVIAPVGDQQGHVERWCTTLHAGATADGHHTRRPHVHIGPHGVGLAAVAAVAAELSITSWREGDGAWTQRFVRGVPTTLPHRVAGPEKGTRVTLVPDRRVFDDVRLDADYVEERLRELAHLLPELTLRLNGHDLSSEVGLAGLLSGPAVSEVVGEHEGVRLHVVARPVTDAAPDPVVFCNLLRVRGGAFVDQLQERLAGQAVAASLWLPEPVYDGRTRDNVSDPRALAALERIVE